MPHVDHAGLAIYYEVEGRGAPLVLQHGLLEDLEAWREQGWTAGLADRQLILIDARGHGRSAKPYDPAAYSLDQRAGDVLAVLADLQIDRADYFGYSMGGWIGLGVARRAPARVRSLIILAQHPYARSMAHFRGPLQAGLDGGPAAFLQRMAMDFGPNSPEEIRRAAELDFRALMALTQDRDSLEADLPRLTMPVLLLAGELDPIFPGAQRAAAALPDARLVPLAGLDHGTCFTQSRHALPYVRAFLDGLD